MARVKVGCRSSQADCFRNVKLMLILGRASCSLDLPKEIRHYDKLTRGHLGAVADHFRNSI